MKVTKLRLRHACAVGILFAWPLLATSVVAPTFESMVSRADLIFSGQVIGQHCEWREIAGQRSIVTLVNFGVRAVHKGRAGQTVQLQFLGGKIGDTALDVAEIPKFRLGERAVLFVEKNGTNASALVGFYHGRFKLEPDGPGREIVVGPAGRIGDVREIGRALAGKSAEKALSHEEFAAKIRETAGRTP